MYSAEGVNSFSKDKREGERRGDESPFGHMIFSNGAGGRKEITQVHRYPSMTQAKDTLNGKEVKREKKLSALAVALMVKKYEEGVSSFFSALEKKKKKGGMTASSPLDTPKRLSPLVWGREGGAFFSLSESSLQGKGKNEFICTLTGKTQNHRSICAIEWEKDRGKKKECDHCPPSAPVEANTGSIHSRSQRGKKGGGGEAPRPCILEQRGKGKEEPALYKD